MNAAPDPYLYPGTDVLRNVSGLRSAEQLATFETAKTAQRVYEIQRTPVVGRFETRHLKTIHRRVFQDVFSWAGELRTTILGKAERVGQPPIWYTTHLLEHEARCTARTCCAESSQASLRAKPPACSRRSMRYIPSVKGMAEHRGLFVDALANQAGITEIPVILCDEWTPQQVPAGPAERFTTFDQAWRVQYSRCPH